MGFGEFLDEGKSETAPAACSGAIVVETHETTPDQFPAAGGDPRPVVGDGDVRMTILAGKSHLDGAAGVLEGVVDEVGHHPGKLRLVARYHRVLDPPGAQLDPDRGRAARRADRARGGIGRRVATCPGGDQPRRQRPPARPQRRRGDSYQRGWSCGHHRRRRRAGGPPRRPGTDLGSFRASQQRSRPSKRRERSRTCPRQGTRRSPWGRRLGSRSGRRPGSALYGPPPNPRRQLPAHGL